MLREWTLVRVEGSLIRGRGVALKRIPRPQRDDVAAEINEIVFLHAAEASRRRWALRGPRVGDSCLSVSLQCFDQLTDQHRRITCPRSWRPRFQLADSITLNVIAGPSNVHLWRGI